MGSVVVVFFFFFFFFCVVFFFFFFFFRVPKFCHQEQENKMLICVTKRVRAYMIKLTLLQLFIYSEIPILRQPKIKTSYLSKALVAKFKLFFSIFSTPCVHLFRDSLCGCPKVVFKTTFGWSQRWSLYRNFTIFAKYYCLSTLREHRSD